MHFSISTRAPHSDAYTGPAGSGGSGGTGIGVGVGKIAGGSGTVDPEELEGTRVLQMALTLPRLGGVGLIHACEERRVRYGTYSICGTMGPEETTDDIVCFLSFQVFVVGA